MLTQFHFVHSINFHSILRPDCYQIEKKSNLTEKMLTHSLTHSLTHPPTHELGSWITSQLIQAYHQYGVGSRPAV
jgi:hypothetical protein